MSARETMLCLQWNNETSIPETIYQQRQRTTPSNRLTPEFFFSISLEFTNYQRASYFHSTFSICNFENFYEYYEDDSIIIKCFIDHDFVTRIRSRKSNVLINLKIYQRLRIYKRFSAKYEDIMIVGIIKNVF